MSDGFEGTADKIERIVAARKREAGDLHLSSLANELLHWALDWKPGVEFVRTGPHIVSVEVREDNMGDPEIISIRTAGGKLIDLRLKEIDRNMDDILRGRIIRISIVINEKTVFSHSPKEGVLGYIPGVWVNELTALCQNIAAAEKDRDATELKARREDPERCGNWKMILEFNLTECAQA